MSRVLLLPDGKRKHSLSFVNIVVVVVIIIRCLGKEASEYLLKESRELFSFFSFFLIREERGSITIKGIDRTRWRKGRGRKRSGVER